MNLPLIRKSMGYLILKIRRIILSGRRIMMMMTGIAIVTGIVATTGIPDRVTGIVTGKSLYLVENQ